MSRSDLTLEDVRPYAGNTKVRNGEVIGTCPVCGRSEHLYMRQEGDKLLVHCKICNSPGGEILKAFKAMGAKPQQVDYEHDEPTEDYRHVYRNIDGTVAFYKRRRKWRDGHKVFGFAYTAPDGKAVYGKPQGSINLYNLDKLATASPDTTLYIVEGEKCVDAMTAHGLLATTSCTGGGSKPKLTQDDKSMLERFENRVVIPDNDDVGEKYASVWENAKILDIVKLWSDCPKKGDIADYFAKGGTADAITSYRWPKVVELTPAWLETCSKQELIDPAVFDALLTIKSASERQRVLTLLQMRASELAFKRSFDQCYKAYLQERAVKGIKSDNMTEFPTQPLALRCGQWITGINGVHRTVQSGMEFKNEVASAIPIMPTEILVNIEDRTEKLRLSYLKSGQWQSIVVPRSTLANKTKIVNLADNGVEVTSDNAGLLVKYLADAVTLNPDILPKVKSTDHMGWLNNQFIPYVDDIKLDCEEQYERLINAVDTAGTFDEWVEYVRPLRKNIYLRLVMAAAFASVLIEPVKALPFVLHLWGGTGSGKTVAMMVAASIWGEPAMGKMVRTVNMTVNAMMSTAAVLRNLPFFGDELQTIKSRYQNYDTLIMSITEGCDRSRMTNAVMQKTRSWLNAFIFTGEEPCTKSASGGGVKNRVIEIECTEKLVENGNAVVNFVANHYGHAGKVFIEAITDPENKLDVAKEYNIALEAVLSIADTTDKQASSMALMWLADTYAQRYVFGEPGDILDPYKLIEFLKSASEVDVAERAFDYIMDVIGTNVDKFDSEMHDFKGNAYWGRVYPDGTTRINKTVLEQELNNAGFDYSAVKTKWREKGYIGVTKDNKLVMTCTLNKVRASYVKLIPRSVS